MNNQFVEMNQIGICVRDLDRAIVNMKKYLDAIQALSEKR